MNSEQLITLWVAVTWGNIPQASQTEIAWRIYLENLARGGVDPEHTRVNIPPVYHQRARQWHTRERAKFLKARKRAQPGKLEVPTTNARGRKSIPDHQKQTAAEDENP